MGSVKRLADEVARGLGAVHPRRRKTVVSQLALAVGSMIEGPTPKTVELAHLLPLDTERQDLREPWRQRLLKNARLDPDAARGAIAPLFSDLKGRGFNLEDSPLPHAERVERLVLIMTLAMHGCVGVGRDDALNHPTALAKKSRRRTPPRMGASRNALAAWSRGSPAVCVASSGPSKRPPVTAFHGS